MSFDPFHAKNLTHLPYTVRILLESVARNADGVRITEEDAEHLSNWTPNLHKENPKEFGFLPSRVVLQDFTGVPVVADLAAMRDAVALRGGDPLRVNPRVPVDLVIDHSVQVDAFGASHAFSENVRLEFERNRERYAFLKWGQNAFRSMRIIPPATGIVHQVNLEYLADVVSERDGQIFPDTVVGTDSHTTMINALGVLGWGVGGIEAEAAMLGQPIAMTTPVVVGVELKGKLREGVTATDLVLTVTEILRKHGVVEKFVEFYGEGARALSLPDRATIANMAPEYGATVGFFPVDNETISYLRLTGRSEEHVYRVERYLRDKGLFYDEQSPEITYSETVVIDLSLIEPSVAGPKRPQDRVVLREVAKNFSETTGGVSIGARNELGNGSVAIAAITSCTNTSNPSVMIAAGLVAQKARAKGLSVPSFVKTSLAPGSKAVTAYLKKAGLLEDLEAIGFHLVGYGCTTCIGNSGPLAEGVEEAVKKEDFTVAAVLSGNRNFEGRVHGSVTANYLASPPLVVAYALFGTVAKDISDFARDILPTNQEVADVMKSVLNKETFELAYADVESGSEEWQQIFAHESPQFLWNDRSTYVQKPPFFNEENPQDIRNAAILLSLGDSVTTDHISPAGAIPVKSPAGKYLLEHGVLPVDFNSYGSRRGNHEVMMRGTFARFTAKHHSSDEEMSVFDAAMRYEEEGTPVVVVAGKDYGMGSSRDWAAKGPKLLGVRAVLFESVERIHRSNLVGMGILPLQFLPGENAKSLGLTGEEHISISGLLHMTPRGELSVTTTKKDGTGQTFTVLCRIDTPGELEYYRSGGILPYVLKQEAAHYASS